MSWIALIALLLVAAYVSVPLWSDGPNFWSGNIAQLRRSTGVASLPRDEWELDHEVGKIDEEEYQSLRATRQREVAQVEVKTQPVAAQSQGMDIDLNVEIEIAIQRERLRLAAMQSAPPWRCDCGREMNHHDKFCASCGNSRPVE